ncbi:MAG TPA: hypothetical protein DCS67_12570 [Clostridiales bacterium UBA8960]|jgi:regulatory protein YycI of two-component signal transduction system YycFG|nr:hypothetical protein [Clostridiales bacterium UBA8960]
MDWPKIKTILIMVLLVTNLMLGFTYYMERLRFETESNDNLEDVIKLYEYKEVDVLARNFKFPSVLKSVNIEFESFDLTNVQNLLGAGFTFDGEYYTLLDKVVILDDTSIVFARDEHINRVKVNFSTSKRTNEMIDEPLEVSFLSDKVVKFIEANNLMIAYDQIEIYSIGDYRVVKLYQMSDGYKFIESNTSFWLFQDEVVGFKRQSPIKISTPQGSRYDIISVDRALYSLLPKIESRDAVLDISLVYKLNDENLLVTNLIQGEALPYYEIVLKSGAKYHIRAVQTIN